MMGTGKTTSQYRIQSVYDAFRVLEKLVASGHPLTAIQLASLTGNSRNRTFRLLKTLEESGYVLSDGDGSAYRATLKLFTLGQEVSGQQAIENLVRPVLERLCEKVDETVYLTFREGDDTVCLLTVESTHMLRITAQPGKRWSLGRGAAGQALLLSASSEEKCRFLNCHPEIKERWPSITARFDREGVTYVDGREGYISDAGVIAIGVPIRDARGHADHAMCVAWPISRTPADIDAMKSALLESAGELERELGYSSLGNDAVFQM
jgi:DNA-binding IclR family transcriptional regulator